MFYNNNVSQKNNIYINENINNLKKKLQVTNILMNIDTWVYVINMCIINKHSKFQ